MPKYTRLIKGTSITWAASGGDKLWTPTSLTNNAAREGAKSGSLIHGTYGLPKLIEFRVEAAVASAATTGKAFEFYVGQSDSSTAGTNNPGNLTGADASLSNPDELKEQCNRLGALLLSNARGTNVQRTRLFFVPTCEYIIPLMVNKTGQTASGTAGNFAIVATPYYSEISD